MTVRTEPPAVSVVMPVLNAAAYLDASIESVLAQTFGDLELVILENGSTDGSASVIGRWAARDPRIRVFEHPEPLGFSGSANAVVARARAPLIARMDADNLCHPRRLEAQVRALERHPDAVLVGTLFEGIDACGRRVRPRDRSALLSPTTTAPFPHGSVMFRRSAFETVGEYDVACSDWGADKELLQRLATVGPVLVLPEALHRVRFHVGSATATTPLRRARSAAATRDGLVARRLPDGRARVDLEARSADDRTLEVLYLQAAVRLWAGERPRLLGALARSRLIGLRPRRLAALAWATWGWASPRTLRSAMRSWIRIRDLAAAVRVRSGQQWRLHGAGRRPPPAPSRA